MTFILAFDIPRSEKLLKLRVNRRLHKINAKKIQFSLWESDKLTELMDVAKFIRANGGSAKY
jgi:hypothetical protein